MNNPIKAVKDKIYNATKRKTAKAMAGAKMPTGGFKPSKIFKQKGY
jgi:hypothetical protein